jgi:hypothetical protein
MGEELERKLAGLSLEPPPLGRRTGGLGGKEETWGQKKENQAKAEKSCPNLDRLPQS